MDAVKEKQLALLDQKIEKLKAAQKVFATYSQEQVNAIFRSAALAANAARIPLAQQAHEETGMGVTEDKIIKNHFASEYIYNKYKDLKTCGEIERDTVAGIIKVAEPIGILAGVVPTTNPTSTTIFKSLIALKTRNGILFSPHPRAKKCTIDAAKLVLEAAVKAGAPEGIISWIDEPSIEVSNALMTHKDVNLILATGGPGMVKAAYSSGKPALGVGAGNTPVIIEKSADLPMAVSSILMSKTFDNGMICASEQSLVVEESIYNEVKRLLTNQGAYILSKEEKKKVAGVILKDGKLNPGIVGQPAYKIAALGGVTVPQSTKVIIGETNVVDHAEAFSIEKLSPVLGLFKVKDFDSALDKAVDLIRLGGMGHTSVLYTHPDNGEMINSFGNKMETGRTLVNMPSSHGAIGDLYNFALNPSLTLGCGSWGGNSVSENVNPEHLINVKTVAMKRENTLWFKLPAKVYFKPGCLTEALKDLRGKQRAFVVTDRYLSGTEMFQTLIKTLNENGMSVEAFTKVLPDPTLSTAKEGAAAMEAFQPDVILALGGGSPMDAAKIMWVLYEHKDIDFEDLALRFMDIRKRIYTFPEMGIKADFVAVPTTSGTGSEVTPFAVITDDTTGKKYPIADYALTPTMSICDSNLVSDMPPALTAFSGIDAVTHALEAIVSVMASPYTTPIAMEAIRLLFEYLPRAYKDGAKDPEAREQVHNASTMAGMAFANAFLGVCHSMAHKLGARFHVPHGLANALLISHVIRYNASEAPTKQGIFPQYKTPEAKERYARVADYLSLGGRTADEKVEKLIEALEELKAKIDIPATIKEAGVKEADFAKAVPSLAVEAFDDQCTGANPRFPLISELETLYWDAFRG
ncbi:bifunctional acetaldehyde-CoA/alcohol dehydrogenase [Spirochaeta cellobiosiphila]|uniref:bifunctional acetaldehyde-CoA/alcohol dehydrogenase n=1 Tax=Spirochaeta cellobiosiphila TaxID=504483 RepID=UPI00042245D7|nr:bifunctional acetaldehyde-CoA/alcohol dehydrogenase [Spirochaeta cellobiosiphila]